MNKRPKTTRQTRLLLTVAFIFCVALWGCKPGEPIRIGFVAGISGRVADLGVTGRDAAQLAVEQCNQTGGISGRKIMLLIKDDQQQPELAKRAVRELIAEGVSAIVGPMTSDMGIAIAPIVSEARVLMVSPTVTTEALTGIDDCFFRVTTTSREFATRNADYQLKTNRMRRVAAAYDLGNKSFTENWLRNFRNAFAEGGGEILGSLGFEVGNDTVFLQIAKDLLALRPDGVVIVANSMDSALLCQQIRKLDDSIPITLADWGATERLLELGGKAVEGVTVVQTFDRASTHPGYLTLRQAYLDRFHREPGFAGVHTYDAVNVVLHALSKQESGQSLKETLLTIREFDGLQGAFSFDDFGDVRRPLSSMSIVRDGQFAVLE
ncbi:MAG: ABC transporter substrate-binding protein [Syntrophobacteraceae bacterium]